MRKLEKLNGILTIVVVALLVLSLFVPGKLGLVISFLLFIICGFNIGCDVQRKVYNKEKELIKNE